MLAAAEVGNRLSKQEYKDAVPDLRVGLVNAQYDLRNADFPVIVLIAGDDRIAANEVVNRLNEWMDARYMRTHVFRELDAGRGRAAPLLAPVAGDAAARAGGALGRRPLPRGRRLPGRRGERGRLRDLDPPPRGAAGATCSPTAR